MCDRPEIPSLNLQFAEDAAHLWHVRSTLVEAPNLRLSALARADDRLLAMLDGLMLGRTWWTHVQGRSGADPAASTAFVLAVGCLQGGVPAAIWSGLLASCRQIPALLEGLVGAVGWVSGAFLRDRVRDFLHGQDSVQQEIGLHACALHRLDPGPVLEVAVLSRSDRWRACACRVAGDVGRVDLLPLLQAAALRDNEPAAPRFWAARSAVLLGDRGAALAWLTQVAESAGLFSDAAAAVALKALDLPTTHQHLRHWAAQAKPDTPAASLARRRLIRRCGITGDPHYIPWLIAQMADLRLTRLAGEAFSMITGADFAWLDLDRKPPAGMDFGPNDDPEDDNVAMDEDDGLPWPDPDKVQAWWLAHQHRFPAGHRFFVGEPPSPAHALNVLRDGFQRQRVAAAQWACLLTPGTPLFPTAAPAWRQQRWLKAMG